MFKAILHQVPSYHSLFQVNHHTPCERLHKLLFIIIYVCALHTQKNSRKKEIFHYFRQENSPEIKITCEPHTFLCMTFCISFSRLANYYAFYFAILNENVALNTIFFVFLLLRIFIILRETGSVQRVRKGILFVEVVDGRKMINMRAKRLFNKSFDILTEFNMLRIYEKNRSFKRQQMNKRVQIPTE